MEPNISQLTSQPGNRLIYSGLKLTRQQKSGNRLQKLVRTHNFHKIFHSLNKANNSFKLFSTVAQEEEEEEQQEEEEISEHNSTSQEQSELSEEHEPPSKKRRTETSQEEGKTKI